MTGCSYSCIIPSPEDVYKRQEQISKVSLIAFTQNDIGNAFWNRIGWTQRLDLNYYDFVLNKENIEAFNE